MFPIDPYPSPSQTPTTAAASLEQLYERDYVRWLDVMVARIDLFEVPQSKMPELDWKDLREELASMAQNKRSAVKSNAEVLLTHLLKWVYQPERRSESWARTINERRNQISNDFEQSAILKQDYQTAFAKCYERARRDASRETGLARSAFPEQCPFDPWQILDPEWWPED